MSPIAIGLDGLLALLLVAALVLGAKLNARLKTLRDSQAGFAAAVIELNQAAARAEAGLNALQTAQGDAHEELLGRIEVARALAVKLERLGSDVERRAVHIPVHSAEPTVRAPAAAPGGALAAIAALAEGRAPARGGDAAAEGSGPGGHGIDALRANPPPRRKPARGAFDEELFEAKPARADDPLGLGALHRGPAETGSGATPAADFGPLEPRAADEGRPRPDPLRNWKAVR